MSLTEYIGRVGTGILNPDETNCKMVRLPHPILNNTQLDILCNIRYKGFNTVKLPILFECAKGEEGLRDALSGIPAQVNRVGSILTVFFTEQPVTGYEQAKSSDLERFKHWYLGLLQRGIYAAPSQFEAMFLSAVHTDAEIGQIIRAAREIF